MSFLTSYKVLQEKLKSYNIQFMSFYRERMELRRKFRPLYSKYKDYSMIPEVLFMDNLKLAERVLDIPGAIVECGTWRGGMIAGIADLLNRTDSSRIYYLFDSFEGLPPPTEKDGTEAFDWVEDKESSNYHDNCSAEIDFAIRAMRMTNVANSNYKIIKGWFSETLPTYESGQPIALLRLDGDWYDSIMECLVNLYPYVAKDGLIILDDYYRWDGCAKALHDYLSVNKLTDRIRQTKEGSCYIIKS